MGRRKPQQEVFHEERACVLEGYRVPCGGFIADSGYDVFITEDQRDFSGVPNFVVTEGGTLTKYVPPEWQTVYSRKVGDNRCFHERSSITGRARLRKIKTADSEFSQSNVRVNLIHRTISSANTAHTVTAERRAQKKLRSHLSASSWRSYVLTGMFYEISRRSGLVYFFRKVAPTIVCKLVPSNGGLTFKPFIVLCMHPVGYTVLSGTGAMCPSDDVIAHLLLMRADEHGYWKKSVHHTVGDPFSMM